MKTLSKIVEWMMPDFYHPGSKKLSYMRTLGWGLFITINLQIIFFVLFYLSDYPVGYAINIICLIFSFISIYFLKYTKRVWLASNIIAAIIFTNTTINAYFTGGLHSSILLWLFIIPIVSIFILERSHGNFWVPAALAALLAFFLFAPEGAPDSITLIADENFDQWINLFLLLAVLWFSSLVIDNAKNAALDEAEAAKQKAHQTALALEAELSQRRLAELALRESNERLSLAINGADMGLWSWNMLTNEMSFNQKAEEVLGYQPGELNITYDQWMKFIHPGGYDEIERAVQSHIDGVTSIFRCECQIQKKNGDWIWILASGMASDKEMQGQPNTLVGILFETTDRKLLENKLLYLANTDALTKLVNRRRFFEMAEDELALAIQSQSALSVALFDVDNFKSINDQYGHLIGDQILAQIAERCLTAIRDTDILARYGGEEFVVLFPCANEADAYKIAERIRIAVEQMSFAVQDQAIHITLSLGVACWAHGETKNLDMLLDWADKALYHAKANGKNRTSCWGVL